MIQTKIINILKFGKFTLQQHKCL